MTEKVFLGLFTSASKLTVTQIQDTIVLRSAIANLLNHHHPEDIHLVMERFFNSGDGYDRFDTPLKNILSPLGGGPYFRDLTEFGANEILSKPSETIKNLVLENAHITIDETFREKLIPLLENRRYQDFATAIMFDARNIIRQRYPQNDNPDCVREFFGQDTMCLHLFEDLSKRGSIWKQFEPSNDFGSDLISLIISAYFAIKERGAYVKSLSSEAGVDELIQALEKSGPELPVQIQDRIKVLSPISELKASLSKSLMTWADIWTVKLMGKIGSKEFIPDLIRVLRHADSMDYIYNDALRSINALDESADESILTAIKSGELKDWESIAILEHLPYAEAFELALNRWESMNEDGMDSYELFSYCLSGIGDRQGIKKLQDIYADGNDEGYIGDSLECLSKIHMIDIPELPDIIRRRKERAERQKTRINKLNKPAKDYNLKKEQDVIESTGHVLPFKRKSAKIGRNEPCLCGSGKKYKKCCLNKE